MLKGIQKTSFPRGEKKAAFITTHRREKASPGQNRVQSFLSRDSQSLIQRAPVPSAAFTDPGRHALQEHEDDIGMGI